MITTKITIENYLAEYLIGKYGTPDSKVVRLPSDLDLYHFDLFDENKHVYGIDYINSAWYFLRKYCIESLSVEALLKDYQRWRRKMRRKTSVREYKHR